MYCFFFFVHVKFSSSQIIYDAMKGNVLYYSCHRFLFFFLGIQPPMASDSGQKSSAAEQELYRRWGEVLGKDNSLASFGLYVYMCVRIYICKFYFSPSAMTVCFNAWESPLEPFFVKGHGTHVFREACPLAKRGAVGNGAVFGETGRTNVMSW